MSRADIVHTIPFRWTANINSSQTNSNFNIMSLSSSAAVVQFGCSMCAAVAIVALIACQPLPAASAVPLAAVKAVSQCSAAPNAVDCLLRAAAAGVDALARSAEPVDLVPGCVTLIKNAGLLDDPTSTTAIPYAGAAVASIADTNERSSAEVSAEAALVDSVTAFAKSRAISVRAPAHLLESLKNTLTEARGKKNKMAGPMLMGAMMVAGTLLPIKLGALAMMSGKAMMTSMLALMLSAIVALKKLASGGGGSHSGTTYEVINVPSQGGHAPHGRSLAHSLAYGLPVEPTFASTVAAAQR